MLTAKSRASNFITKVVRQKNTLLLISQAANVRLIPVSDCVVRIICVKEENGEIEEWLEQEDGSVQWNFTVDENIVCMQLTGLLIKIDRASSSISYYKPDGTLLLKERKKDSRTMEAFQSYRVASMRKVFLIFAVIRCIFIRQIEKLRFRFWCQVLDMAF